MVLKTLNAAQKMDIVEKAIQMGAHIEIKFHMSQLKTKATVSDAVGIFSGMDFTEHNVEDLNYYEFRNGYEKFEGTVFLPDYYPLPIGWADAGDVEEDSGQ